MIKTICIKFDVNHAFALNETKLIQLGNFYGIFSNYPCLIKKASCFVYLSGLVPPTGLTNITYKASGLASVYEKGGIFNYPVRGQGGNDFIVDDAKVSTIEKRFTAGTELDFEATMLVNWVGASGNLNGTVTFEFEMEEIHG